MWETGLNILYRDPKEIPSGCVTRLELLSIKLSEGNNDRRMRKESRCLRFHVETQPP